MENMRILFLEDHKSNHKHILQRLNETGHQVDVVDNGHRGFLTATANSYDVIISDLHMPHWDGAKFIEAMEVVCPQLPIVLITSPEEDTATAETLAKYTNVVKIITKPVIFSMLQQTLTRLPLTTHVRLKKMARIVATIGPSSSSSETLGKMILAGMDVARLNFSHGSYATHESYLEAIRQAEGLWERPIAVMVDLSGPKIRTGPMQDDCITLVQDRMITIQAEAIIGTAEKFSTISPEILGDLKVGDPILLDDGLLELRVVETGTHSVQCEIITGGQLRSNKGMNLPETNLSLPSITDKDWRDLKWAIDHSVDYVALSFVRAAEEIIAIKRYIRDSTKPSLRVIAKIEKPEALKNLKEIIAVSDAVMIARGDMGVEIPAPRVPWIQQKIINQCWQTNTPVITATQMLDSMTLNSRPTRAEVTDVSVAIQEGTDAVMLSQETATGRDPVNVVRTMASIICEEESHAKFSIDQYQMLVEETSVNPVLTAVASLNNTNATILFDPDGTLYPVLSKWNRKVTSIVITCSLQVARHASLYKNIVPLIINEEVKRSDLIYKALELTKEEGYIRTGDIVALVEGNYRTTRGIQQIGTLQLITA